MKRSVWFSMTVVLLLAAVALLVEGQAAADPQAADHQVLLPLISSPSKPKPPLLDIAPFASGFGGDTITAIVHAGDDRLFVAERTGRIYVVQADGTVASEPFLDISDKVRTENWEEGLLGLAFHPAFPAIPHFFITYTPEPDREIAVSRFRLKKDNPDLADQKSEVMLMRINKQGAHKRGDYRVHNAGDLHFGPDGYLYIATGDGGPDPWDSQLSGDPDQRGQSTNDLLASILRIDVNVDGSGLKPDCGLQAYEIPADNPFVDGYRGPCDELWSIGLRNPYRFSFDRQTGEMYIGEVGEHLREEIIHQPAGSGGGQNYGWACYEGTVPYKLDDPAICPPGTSFAMPIFEYDQSMNDCSVIGGYVYRGQQHPELAGRYVFGDFCTGRMWLLNRESKTKWTRSLADNTLHHISTFGEGLDGELYLGERGVGSPPAIYRITIAP